MNHRLSQQKQGGTQGPCSSLFGGLDSPAVLLCRWEAWGCAGCSPACVARALAGRLGDPSPGPRSTGGQVSLSEGACGWWEENQKQLKAAKPPTLVFAGAPA